MSDHRILERVLMELLRLEASREHDDLAVVPKHHIRQLVKPGLKVMRMSDRVKQTVVRLHGDRVTLRQPEGGDFDIDLEEFEKEYAVD